MAKMLATYGPRSLPPDYCILLVSPSSCGSCFGQLKTLMKNRANDQRYLFIIPERSRKEFNLSFEPSYRFQSNVLRDSLELFLEEGGFHKSSNYVFYFKQGKMTDWAELMPENINAELVKARSLFD